MTETGSEDFAHINDDLIVAIVDRHEDPNNATGAPVIPCVTYATAIKKESGTMMHAVQVLLQQSHQK